MKKYIFPTDKDLFVNYNHNDYPELHCHTYWEFVLITEGSFTHIINNQPHTVNTDTLLIIRPEDTHALKGTGSYINLGTTEEFFLAFIQKLYPNEYQSLKMPPYVEVNLPHMATLSFVTNIQSLMLYDKESYTFYSLLKALFVDFLREIIHNFFLPFVKTTKYSPTITALIEKMRCTESFQLTIEELLQDTNYAHSHILRLFKKETGRTITQFFQKIKLKYAKNLLESSNQSIASIVLEIGFSNIGHFTNLFKKEYGVTPSEYRKNWKQYYQSFEDV